MEVRLSVTNGKANVKQVVLGPETIIGRSHECNLKIASSQVSRRHCRITVNEGEVKVCDLGSANGTFLNGRALPPEMDTLVAPGNALTIGPLRFVFHYKPPVPPKVLSDLPESDTKDAIPLALLGRPASQLGEEETVDPANQKRGGVAAKISPLGPAVPMREEEPPVAAHEDDDFEEGLPDRTMAGLKEPIVVTPPEGAADTVLDMNLEEEARRKAAQQQAAQASLPPGEVSESSTDSGTALLHPDEEKGYASDVDDTIQTDGEEFPDFKAADLADEGEEPEESPRAPTKGRKSADKGKDKKPWNLLGGMFGGKAKPKRPAREPEAEEAVVEEVIDEEEPVAEAPPPTKAARVKPQPKPVDDEADDIGLPVSFPEPAAKSEAVAPPAADFDPADFLLSLAGKEQVENLDPRTKPPGDKPVAGKPPEKKVAPRLSPLEKPSEKPSPAPQVKSGTPPQKGSGGEADDGSLDDFLKNL